jgi:DNA-binding IclR family transcriptional regulator
MHLHISGAADRRQSLPLIQVRLAMVRSDPPDTPAAAASPGNRVQVIDRAFMLLRALLTRPNGASALELAQATQLDRTTVHRLLRTLAHWGMVQAQDGGYTLGPECLVLGSAQQDRLNIRRASLPHAIELQERGVGKRQAVVSISVPARDEVVIIERIWTPSTPLNIITDIGTRFPIDGSVSGRAILAASTAQWCIDTIGAKRHAAIKKRLEAVRADGGISFGLSEVRPGVGTMACPIVGRHGVAVAALIVAGLSMEKDLHAGSPLAQHVQRAANSISSLVG